MYVRKDFDEEFDEVVTETLILEDDYDLDWKNYIIFIWLYILL